MKLNQMKVGTRLLLSFIAIALSGAIVAGIGIVNMGRINDMGDRMYEQELLGLSYVKEANISLIYIGRALRSMLLASSEAERATHMGRVETRRKEVRANLDFLMAADDPSFVYFLEVRGRGTFLRAAPIDVSDIVRELLLDDKKGTVLTSATLAVDGSFEYVKGRLGVRRAKELRLDSEFDYARQAILYLPARMPDPRAREFGTAATPLP